MDLISCRQAGISDEAIDRIRRHIALLVQVYFKIADRHVNPDNEEDLEHLARVLLAFSGAMGSHIRRSCKLSKGRHDATSEEMHFYELSYGELNRF